MASRNGFWTSRKQAKKSGPVEQPRKRRRPLGFMPLEPRIMYDGAGPATVAHHQHHEHGGASPDAAQAGPPGGAGAVTPSGGDGHWHPYAAPVLAAGTPNAAYTGTGPAATLDSGLTLSAPGRAGNLTGATVAITSGLQSGDVLSFNNGTNTETFSDGSTIVATFSNGVLTLSGKASALDYQNALQQVQFTSSASSGDPTAGGTDTSRGIAWQVNDGVKASASATTALAVAEPLPTIFTAVNNPTEIVFIDPRAPDAQLLENGVKAGIEVVVLDPNTDGMLQIANFLALHPDPNLTTIDIVAHGSDGMLFLGNAVLDNATVGQYTAQLQTIGTALQPGGDLMLYGCDVAANPDGVILLAQITDATGVNVAASVGPVGSAAEGGSWTLTATSGPIDAAVPFTAATLAAYTDVLNVELFGTLGVGLADGIFSAFDNNGNSIGTATGATQAYSGNNTLNAKLQNGNGGPSPAQINFIQLDAAAGLYFVLESGNQSTPAVILEGSLTALLNNPTVAPTFTTLFTDSVTFQNQNDNNVTEYADVVNAFQVDVADNVIFINDILNDNNFNSGVTRTDKVEVLTFSGPNFSGTETTKLIGSLTNQFLQGMVVDPLNHAAYFYETASTQIQVGPNGKTTQSAGHGPIFTKGGSQIGNATNSQHEITITAVTQDALFKATWNSNTSPSSFTFGQLPISPADGSLGNNNFPTNLGRIEGLALDGSTLYFDTSPIGTATGKSAAGIYSYSLSGQTSVTAGVWNGSAGYGTVVTMPTGASSLPGVMTPVFVIDQSTNKYYVTLENNTYDAVYDGSLSGGTPTLFENPSSAYNVQGDFPATVGLALDDAPVLTPSGSAVTYDQGGAAAMIDGGVIVADNNNLASATVSVTTHFQSGDVLGIAAGDFTGNSINGTNITESYNSSTGVLTLTGLDTAAHYQTALREVTFSSTYPGTPSVSPRTITFSVSDGLASASANDTVNIHDLPVVTAGASATFSGGGSAQPLDAGLTVTLLSSTTLASATVSIGSANYLTGDILNFTNTNAATEGNISGSYNAGTLTLTSLGSTATRAQWQTALESITYGFTAGGDPTGGGGDTSRTINWVVNDGTASSSSVTSAVTTVHVAPTETPSGLTATFTGGGAAVALDSGFTVNDADSATLASATVSITGFITGDMLNFTSTGTISGNYDAITGVLTLNGTDTIAHYRAALDSITYSFTANGDPTGGGNNTSRTMNWTVTDGSTSNGTSATGTSNLTTVHVAPTVTAGASASYNVGGSPALLDSALTVSDVDSAGNLHGATVSIGTGFVAGDTLGFTAQAGITASYTSGTGVLTLSGNASLNAYQTELDSITFSTSATTAGTRTIDWVVSDGSTSNGASAQVTSAVQVFSGPQFSGTGTTVNYQETGAAVAIDTGLGLTDPAGARINSVTVTIGGFVSGDVLAIPAAGLTGNTFTGTNVAESYNSSSGVLTLSGSDTAAHYQSALDAITYSFTANPITAGTARTISYTATDANSISSTANPTNTVDLVHTAPTVTAGTPSVTFTGGGSAQVLDSGIIVSDPDSGGTLSGATVTLSGGIVGDTLNFTNTTTIAGVYNAGTGALTLTGTDTVADYQAALDSITYSFTANGDPTGGGTHASRTIDWIVTDGSPSNGTSNIATSSLTTVHAAPSVTAGAIATFNGGGSAVTLDSGLSVTDADSGGQLTGATVSVGIGFISGDTLNFTNQNGITGTYNAANGVLTLTGTTSTSNYQTALASITYSFTANADPTGGGTHTSRAIDWSVTDGSTSNGTSNTATSSLTTTHVAPIVTAGATVTFNGGGSAVILDSGLSVTDVDSGGNLVGATVSIGTGFIVGDTLNFTNQNGITGSYNATTGVLSLSGSTSLAHYQTAIESITYSFTANGDPTNGGGDTTRAISWSVTDGSTSNGASNAATSSLTTTHVAPVVTAGASVTFNGGGAAVALDSTLTVSDGDSGGNLTGATVSIGTGFQSGDALNFSNTAKITSSYNAATGTLTLTGTDTVADYQAALDSITYSFTSGGDPTVGGAHNSRTIDWNVTDGSTSNGTSTTATSSLTTVHAAPSVTAGTTATFTGGGSAVMLDSTLTVTDADSGGNLNGATVSIGTGFVSGDALNFTNTTTITSNYNATTGILTLIGTDTVANYQAALDSITYSFNPAFGDPTGGGTHTSRSISWTVTDGSTSHGVSNTATSSLTTTHVAPTLTTGGSATYVQAGTAATLDSTLSLSDPDSGGLLTGANVQITSGLLTGDTLSATTSGLPSITASYNAGTGTLALSGSDTLADYQAVLRSVTFSSTSSDPTSASTDPSRTLTWTINDGVKTNQTTEISTLNIHALPTVTAGAITTFTGGGAPVALDGTLTVSDTSSSTLTGATVSIGAGFLSGDTLNFTNTTAITGSYNAATGVLTLSGSDTVANYQAALDSIAYSFSPTNGDPTSAGADTSRSISFVVNDGVASSTAAIGTLNTVHVAPVVTAGATATFTGGSTSPVTLDGTLTVSDADSGGNLTGATVSIGTGFVTGDTLNFNNTSAITGSYVAATGILTLTGTDTVANYQAALDSISYSFSPTNGDPTNGGGDTARTINWSVIDGSNSHGTSAPATSSVTTSHVAPVVAAGATATFETGSLTDVALDSTLAVSDVDSGGNLTSATVSIGTGFVSGDTLYFTNTANITGSYNSGTGVLTLIGTDTLPDYQAALDSITFITTATAAGNRTIDWSVTDGSTSHGTSTTATSAVNVIKGPEVTAGASVSYTEGQGVVALDPALTVIDPVSSTLASATVSVGSGFLSGDTLNFTNQNNITGSYNAATGVLTLTGTDTVANYQTALDSIYYTFTPANGDPTDAGADSSRTIGWSVSDGRQTGTATSTVTTAASATTVSNLVLTPSGTTTTFDQGDSPAVIDSGITVSETTNPTTIASATVTISGNFQSGDVLGVVASDLTGNAIHSTSITESYDSTHGVLTLTGTDTIADYQLALSEVTFTSTAAPLSIVPRSVTFAATDSSAVTGSAFETVDIHDQPVVSAGTPSVTFTGGGSAVTLDSGLTLSDPSGTTLASATVSIGTGFSSGDTLNFTDTTHISGAYDVTTGILTLTGNDTVANYQAALDSVSYSFSPTNGDPTGITANDTSRSIAWQVNDGTVKSAIATTSLTTAHMAPVVTAGTPSVTFTGGDSGTTLDGTLTVTDADSGGNLTGATVSIGTGFVTGGDVLGFAATNLTNTTINGTNISESYNSSTGVLTLSGTDSVTNYQTALDEVQFSFNPANGDPTNGGADTARSISWSATDGSTSNGVSNTASTSLTVTHAAPVVTAGATATFAGGDSAVTLDSTLTVTDADSGGNLTGATVSIGTGFVTGGDVLGFAATNLTNTTINGTNITESYNSSTGVLTLSGTDSVTNYLTALDEVQFSFNPAIGDPTNGGGDTTRSISWTVTDGSTSHGVSNTATSSLTTTHVAPTLTTGGSATYVQAGTAATLDSTLSLSDPDSGGLLTGANVQITSGLLTGDTLSATTSGLPSITASYNAGTGTLALSGSDTLADYQAVLRSVTFSSTSSDPTSAGTDPSRTVTWTINDGVSTNTTTETSTVNVHALPTVTAGATATFTGGGSPVALDGTLTVSDTSSSTLTGATVSIGAGFLSGDTLNFTNTTTITGSYVAATGILTLTGSDTVANYKAALDSITYNFSPTNGDPTNAGADTSRSLSFVVNDGVASSTTATSTLDTVHAAPVVTAGTPNVTFTGGDSAATLDSTLSVSDPDSGGNLTGATVSIGTGFQSGDVLSFNGTNTETFTATDGKTITGSYNVGTGVLTLSGTASTTDYQTALDQVQFSFNPANSDPTNGGADTSRSISWSVTDGSTSNGVSNTATTSLTVAHAAPVVTVGATPTFTGGGSAVTLDSTLTVTDADSGGNLTGATVSIGTGFLGGDTLNFTSTTNITGSYNATTGILTLSGTDTVANYQSALDSIAYSFSPINGNPTGGGTDTARTINWSVTDGSTSNGTSDTATSALDTVHVAPVVTAGATATFTGGGSVVTLDSGLTLSDVDSGGNLTRATVSIGTGFTSGDTLNFTNTTNITGSYNSGTGVLTLTGTDTVADYQAALDSITYSFTANGDPTGGGTHTSRTIDWSVTDASSSNGTSNTASSTLGTVHVAPVVKAGATATFNGGGSAVTLDSTLTLTDADSGGNLTSATVSIGTGFISGDVLGFVSTNLNNNTINGTNIAESYNSSTGVLTLTGTDSVANYQSALQEVQYSFTPQGDPTGGGTHTSRTIDWSVTDASSSNGTSNTATSTLGTVHVAPVVTAGATVSFDGGGSAVPLDSTLTLTDADSGGNLTSSTVSIGTGFQSGDVLNFTNTTTIAGNYNANTGVLTLTGTDTVANYRAALDSITYSFTPNSDPTAGGTHTGRTIDWSVTDASTSNGASNTATSTLDVVHEPPSLSTGGTVTYVQAGSPVPLDTGLTVSDPDSGGNLTGATVSISTGFLSGDTLNFTNTTNITGSYNSGTGVLTLTGSDTVVDYQAALASITYSSTSGNPTSDRNHPTRTVTWSVNDGVNANQITQTSTVDVHALPTMLPGTPNEIFTVGGSPATLGVGLTVNDNSSTTLASATVSIGSGFINGDTLSFNGGTNTETFTAGDGKTITGGYNAGTGVLTLSGTASTTDYQTALGQVQFSFSTANGDPTNGGGDVSRSISWQITDGTAMSVAVNNTLDVAHAPPTVATLGVTATFEGGGSAVTLDTNIAVNDVDSGGNLTGATVSIGTGTFISGDLLGFATTNLTNTTINGTNITESYNSSTGVLTLSGTDTLADYENALREVQYSFSPGPPNAGDPTNGGLDTARTISWAVTDGSTTKGTNSTASSALDTVHEAPVVTAGSSAGFEIGAAAQPVTLDSGLTVSDADSLGNLSGATVSIGAGFLSGSDTLAINGQASASGTITDGDGSGIAYNFTGSTLTLSTKSGTASVTDYQTALESVTFSTTTTTAGNRTIDWTVTDGVLSSVLATSSVAVSSGPQVTAGGTVTFIGGGVPATLDSSLTVIDQSNSNLVSASATISSGLTAGDTLSFNSGTNTESFGDGGKISATYDATHGILSLTGTASATDYQTALEQVQYSFNPTNADPTAADTETVRTITWGASDGVPNTSPASSTLDVVHAPPIVTAGTPHVTFSGGGSPTTLDAGLTLIVPDSSDTLVGATVTIGTGLQSGDVLSFNAGANIETFADGKTIAATYNSTTGTLTLTGTASGEDYQNALDHVQFSFSPTNADPTAGGGDTSRGLTWQVNDGVSLSSTAVRATTALNVVHTPPSVTPSGVTADFHGLTPAPLDGGLTVSDLDSSGNLTGAMVTIGTGFRTGDTLNFTNQDGIIGNYNATTGVLTLSGHASVANYQAALDSITYSFTPATGDPTGGIANDSNRTISWVVTDGSTTHGTSATATSTLHVSPNLVPPPVQVASVAIPPNIDHGHFGDFFPMLTNIIAPGGGDGPGVGFGAGKAFYLVHTDVTTTVADNGLIDFGLPLTQLQAALGGDVVSVSASLADGQPLPSWLHFNSNTGQFAGLLPDDIATGSIGPEGDGGHPHGPNLPHQSITIEVLARDSKGNLAITDFTIDLSALKPHVREKHGWNVLPGDGTVDPFATNRRGRDHVIDLAALAAHRDVAPLHAMDRVLWHNVAAFDTGRAHGNHSHDPAPAGRAGLSDQIKGLGWHAASADRMALLESLRQGVAGWR